MSDTQTRAAAESSVLAPRGRTEKDVLSRKEVADYVTRKYFPCAVQTLANMASNSNKGGGPKFTRAGWRHVQYRRSDVDAWADKRMVAVE
jgi:hypothetical protein